MTRIFSARPDAVLRTPFEAYAREASAKAIAALSVTAAISIVVVWPTDLLIDSGAPGLLRQFALYRLSVCACAALVSVAVLRSAWLRARPALALLGGCVAFETLMLVTLAPNITLDHGWMDLQYLWPLVTVALFVPLLQRVVFSVGLTGAMLALTLAFVPGELARPYVWVNAVVFGLSTGVSVFIGARVYGLVSSMYASARGLEEHNLQLAARVASTREHLRRRYERIVDERERERSHLSRELHDATGQLLTAVRLTLGALRREGARRPEDVVLFDELDATLDELFARVQRILLELRPKILDDLGLAEALDWLARSTSKRHGVAVAAEVSARGDLDARTSISLYRVAQRALELLARLDAPIALELQTRGRELRLRAAAGARLGELPGDVSLLELEERARILGARLQVTAGPPATVLVERAGGVAE